MSLFLLLIKKFSVSMLSPCISVFRFFFSFFINVTFPCTWNIVRVAGYSAVKPVPISCDRARAKGVRKCKHAPRDREPSRIPRKKTSSLFHKDKVIRNCMVHYLKDNVVSSSELRKCLSLAFGK